MTRSHIDTDGRELEVVRFDGKIKQEPEWLSQGTKFLKANSTNNLLGEISCQQDSYNHVSTAMSRPDMSRHAFYHLT